MGRQAPAGTCRHSGGRASSSAPEPVWKAARLTAEARRLGGPARRDRSPPSPTGPLTTMGAGGSRQAARCLRMERGGAGGAWREQVPTSRGPIRGPKYYPHHGSDGQAHWVWGPGPVRTMMARMPAVRAKAGRTPDRWTDAGEVSGTPWYDSDPSQDPDPSRAPHCRPWGWTNARRPPRVPLGLVSAVRRGASGIGPTLDRAEARPGALNG